MTSTAINIRLVSVVIPCFNGEAYLSDSIDSVLHQTYKNIELIVVDDGSTDNSPAIMKNYGDRLSIVRQKNCGLSAARNAGIRACHGDYYAFLDADDFWEKNFITKMVNALIQNNAEIAYCGWQNVGLSGRSNDPFIPPDYEAADNKVQLLVENTRWPVHAAMITKNLLDTSGAFDTQWKYCEDFAFWIRTATFNKLVLVPEVLAFYRFHDNQMTTNHIQIALNVWKVQNDFFRKNPAIVDKLGTKLVRQLTHGNLLKKAYEAYWKRDIETSRTLFRISAKTGYASLKDWKYILPALLPKSVHLALIRIMGRD